MKRSERRSGTAYEKLQVLHQGVAGLHLYMVLVHTIAMARMGVRYAEYMVIISFDRMVNARV